MSKELEDKPQTRRQYLQKTSDQGLLYKGLLKLSGKETNNPYKKTLRPYLTLH